ncbi:MAG: HAD family hydrolase [Nostoc sp. DedQUE08]|uniref:HAD family hydrolase n=1 Tax=unclassified Nostoc TaxID=2593658 RepID=UPI002AD200A5|nr:MULTISPECIES: HAD family hydrolase [unclassified Nostoc]MDZ8029954.1 HAD family hydrolase [Nostoc sp. DedSLP04]MDZ8065064.1 HAD family hydrolase [Nostoc sp. DedQUE08]MDZ8096497.1 HAD family hydrolase [Nostoc sp. DedQUE05]MDZ8131560.1 HAD family hydrolase [Nostoc sp. DedQUE07]MDZ8139110.1 HAD family hydrolase [Nostoc sp. DedQUE04]
MTNLELIIFDCDGVLVNSEPIVNRIFAETLTEGGLTITYEEVTQQFMGKSLATCLEIIKKTYGKPVPAKLLERCKEREIAALQQELQATEGIAAVLEQITLPRCVASNSSPRHIQFVLQLTGLLHQFDGKLYSSHHVERPKPFPDVYLYAASQMGKTPENCLVIEDSVTGVQAASAARMQVFGYTPRSNQGNSSHHDALIAAGAKLVFEDMYQLPILLKLWK